MALVSRNILKAFFIPGAKPTSAQFNTLIDSTVNYLDDRYLLGLKNYDSALIYVLGDTVIYNQIIYQAKATTIVGAFDISKWNKIAGSTPGSVNYKGAWNASTNTPNLNTVTKAIGDYYVVSIAGNTSLNSPPNVINDWEIGDWAIFDGTLWGKIDNSDAVTDAANVAGVGAGIYQGKNNTVLQFKKLTNVDGSLDVTDGANIVDLGINFDDAGVSASRAWSAFKIDAELATKEPLLGYTAEDVANKVNALSGTSTNVQYPSAKLVFDQLAFKQNNLGYTPENVANKVITLAGATDTQYPSAKLILDQLALKQNSLGYTAENVANKVIAISGASTNTEYPTAKLTFDQLALKENLSNKVTAFQVTPDNTHYPSEKLVADKFATLSNVQNTKVNLSATIDPTVSNDSSQGYSLGSSWINTILKKEFVCVDATAGAAVWKETTNFTPSVFGNNYVAIESTISSTTSNIGFQPCQTGSPVITMALNTGSVPSGTYRIQWSCLVTNNQKLGEFRLVDNTVPASPVQVGQSLIFQASDNTEKISLAGIANINFSGNRQYILQFRSVNNNGGNTQTMQIGSKIEFWRVS